MTLWPVLSAAQDGYNAYANLTGGTVDEVNTGLLSFTPAQFARLQNLNFHIGGSVFELTPDAQIWPRHLNACVHRPPPPRN